jgi:flagellar hook protein FlgE
MMASLFSGVSGLKNHQVKMNVIGNNIANINTIGYKGSRVNFQEALVQTYKGAGRPSTNIGGTNPVQLGMGMQVATIDNLFQQGGLETTGQITDLAIQGKGFFILADGGGNRFYTRAGAFGFDAGSNLVDPSSGLYVQGKMADNSGNIPSLATIGMITLPFGQQDPAKPSEIITLGNNLDASASDSVATLETAGTSNILSVSGTTVDGVGGTHSIDITGAQASQATFTGATVVGLLGTATLGSLGVNVFDDFQLTIDGTRTENVSGLSATSSVNDLVNAISQIDGITATLTQSGGPPATQGAITITRNKAGDSATYGVVSSASNTATANIVDQIFGVANGATFQTAGGTAASYVITDTFTPNRGSGSAAGPEISMLNMVVDDITGLATGITGIGGGGISVITGTGGLAAASGANALEIDTANTIHTTSINVYDSQGGRHTLTLEFYKSMIQNRWEWTAGTLGSETVTSGGTGYVSFNSDGSLNTFDYNGGASEVTINPNNGASNMLLAFDPGTVGNYDGLTGFGSGTHTAAITGQDGYGLGILEKITIDQSGNISGIFSNGVTRILAQMLLADFTNAGGLRKSGKSMYQPTANSGEPLSGVAGETIGASISSGALESSSVDIAQEFTGMITAQRGFQANARIITTSDSMLDELVNIKR